MTITELKKILEREENKGNGNKTVDVQTYTNSNFILQPRFTFDNRAGGLVMEIS